MPAGGAQRFRVPGELDRVQLNRVEDALGQHDLLPGDGLDRRELNRHALVHHLVAAPQREHLAAVDVALAHQGADLGEEALAILLLGGDHLEPQTGLVVTLAPLHHERGEPAFGTRYEEQPGGHAGVLAEVLREHGLERGAVGMRGLRDPLDEALEGEAELPGREALRVHQHASSSNTSSGRAADTSAFGASTSSDTRSSAATLIST
jgi:hypothetical protein